MPPVCLDAPTCLDTPTYVWMLPVCFDDVWVPPVHTQHKACFVRLGGVHMLQYIWMPPYAWMLPVCLDAPCMFRWPHMFEHPHILNASCMFGYPPYVWMPPVCLDDVWMPAVHIQPKESILFQTKGVSICPHTFVCPQMFGCPPVCL